MADARQVNFAADDFNTASLNTTFGGARQSDARLDAALTAAQEAVRADTNRYEVNEAGDAVESTYVLSDGEYFLADVDGAASGDAVDFAESEITVSTARQLQSQYNAAVSTQAGDVSRNGETLAIASSLSDAIGSFLAQNADDFSLSAIQTKYLGVVAALDTADGNAEAAAVQTALGEWKVAVDAAIVASFDGVEADFDRTDVARTDANEDLPTAIVDGLLSLNTRFTNDERVEDTKAVFEDTVSGEDFLFAEGLSDDRAELVQDLADAEAVVEALETAFAEYEAAGEAVDAAAEALGYDVVSVDDGILFGEADTDELFVFNADDLDDLSITDVTVNDLEAGDALFFGTDYSLGGETGDNNALEFFVSTNIAGDVVVNVENSAFGSAQNDDYNVTLTGISEDQLNIDGGVISIVEVA